MCKDLKDCLKAGRDEVETSKGQKRTRGRPAGNRAPGKTRQQSLGLGVWDNQEEPGKRGPGRSYPEPISLGDAKAHFALSIPTGSATILVHTTRATRLSKLSLTLNRTIEDHRPSPKRGPREGGPSRQEPGEVSLKLRAEPQVSNESDPEIREGSQMLTTQW